MLAFVPLLKPIQPVSGSTARGSEYQGTTTSPTTSVFPAENLIQSGSGTLGSVVVTATAAGIITLYDATTSNISLRGNTATSSLILANFAASPTVGTYTFDRSFYNGLYVSITGAAPTTTITFRQ